ncbi:solute carrier organic anion transporter family member 4A1-like [Ylistrum balloti]|uniref:solute carrier organic anion transporter family member 4A1-like n=1 Tax=Ylistrum balloti TaxID=509963 RepID=UPI002905EE5A|nr:solute carrier organic anion transporter family member 4A1-like [Ylistrum balloti]
MDASMNAKHGEDVDSLNHETCGWGPFRPRCCQRFRSPRYLLLCLCGASFIQGMVVNGLISVVISSLEKRYSLSSSESGLIASCYDIMSAISLIPISYFGGIGVKSRYISLGLMSIAVGSFIFSLPHFTSDVYNFGRVDDDQLCLINGSSSCSANSASTSNLSVSDYKYVFYLAMLLMGVGSVPLFTLAQPFLDESVPVRSASLYLGIYHCCNVLGPAAGYIIGAVSLSYYVDIDRIQTVTINSESSRFVGAWWVGFLFGAILAVIMSIPLMGFPRMLPKSTDYKEGREKETYKTGGQLDRSLGDGEREGEGIGERKTGILDVYKSFRVLFMNPTFVFLTLAETTEGFVLAGSSTFLPKFAEVQFSLPAATAALYVGAAIIPAGGLSTFMGGFIVKRFNLSVRGILKLCVGLMSMATVLGLFLLIHCPSVPFAGVNIEYGVPSSSGTKFLGSFRSDSCYQNCSCTQADNYNPVCGVDGITFYSPCYAGCYNIDKTTSPWSYRNCSCVEAVGSAVFEAQQGTCESTCTLLSPFLILSTIFVLTKFMVAIPALTATLRCVPHKQRAFSLGIQWTVSRCLGFIPGPIVFGKLIDLACLLWQTDCENEGSCFFYNNEKMSYLAMAIMLCANVVTAFFIFLSLRLYRTTSAKIATDQNKPADSSFREVDTNMSAECKKESILNGENIVAEMNSGNYFSDNCHKLSMSGIKKCDLESPESRAESLDNSNNTLTTSL